MKMILRHLCCPDLRLLVGIVFLFGSMLSAVEGQKLNATTGGFRKRVVEEVDIGVILDLDESTMVGKMSKTSISMAIFDYYQLHNETSIRIVPHIRNSNADNVEAASASIDLLKNVQVKAIIGPQRSTQTGFVINIADKAEVPIISLPTSPSLSPKENPYFIRTAQCSSFQAKPIAAIVEAFGRREVVFVYEESKLGRGLIPNLTDAMIEVNAQVKYRSILSPSASDDQVMQELNKLMTLQTRVFLVHLLPSLASRFFVMANEAGMMNKGYAWIVTDVVTSLLHSLSPRYIDSMQGVLGVKLYIPKSKELEIFSMRWKRNFLKENPDIDRIELDMFGIWAYDSTFALATALERVGLPFIQRNNKFSSRSGENSSTDLAAFGSSDLRSKLLPLIRNIKFKGVSGDFHVSNGQLKSSAYEIVNVIGTGEKKIGFWSLEHGLSKKMNSSDKIHGYIIYTRLPTFMVWPNFNASLVIRSLYDTYPSI